MDTDTDAAPLTTLLENHRAFLRYLERRVGDRALAEDILQEAFAKVVARPELAPNDEAIIPWFYRTLRNAAVDQFRRRGAADRAYEAFARELETHEAPTSEMRGEICTCVSRLASTLKPEYAEALAAIEVGGHACEGIRRGEGLVIEQRGGARLPCARGAEETGHRIVRGVCGAWMRELHVHAAVMASAEDPFSVSSALWTKMLRLRYAPALSRCAARTD